MSGGALPPPNAVGGYLDMAGIAKSFRGTPVLQDLDFAVSRGEFVSLLGPSGCGKTTLLRLIAGLMPADSGRIVLEGRDLTRLPAHRRRIGVVFQNYALFPHLNVFDNVAFGLKAQRSRREAIRGSVMRFLDLVQMSHLAERSVAALSGGQQQRVAVARALAVQPALLLLDEPFSALDRKLRETMQIDLRSLLRELGITAVFVTHDQEEALIMSDRIAVMNAGRIEQFDSPSRLYRQPRTGFVLGFIGSSIRLEGRLGAAQAGLSRIDTALGRFHAPTPDGDNALAEGTPVTLAVRPENIRLEGADQAANRLDAILLDRMFLGPRIVLQLQLGNGARLAIETPAGPVEALPPGARVALGWSAADTLVVPA